MHVSCRQHAPASILICVMYAGCATWCCAGPYGRCTYAYGSSSTTPGGSPTMYLILAIFTMDVMTVTPAISLCENL